MTNHEYSIYSAKHVQNHIEYCIKHNYSLYDSVITVLYWKESFIWIEYD